MLSCWVQDLTPFHAYIASLASREGIKGGLGFTGVTQPLPRRIYNKIECIWIKAVTGLLPKAFRAQNVSYARVGERHFWLWDYCQLKSVVEKAGFNSVERQQFNSSCISNFLDVDEEGLPQKGVFSMYVEAKKRYGSGNESP
jgi:hypothetical protein